MNAFRFPRVALALVLSILASGCAFDPGDGDGDESTVDSDALSSGSLYVSPSGSDSASGTLAQPFKTVAKGLKSMGPGGTLYLRGGTYVENVSVTPAKGTSASRITVKAYEFETPIIKGLLALSSADYWTVSGIKVTWNDSNASDKHMVKMSGGTGWRIENCEFWGAKSFAGLLISGSAKNIYVGHNRIHDTFKSNATNQDHLIYANQIDGGIIERNALYNSSNGRAIKVGSLSSSGTLPRGLVIRYNTMYNNLGPSNLQFSYAANSNEAYRNIFVKSSAESVTQYSLSGSGNVAHDNIGFLSSAVVGAGGGLKDGGGNLRIDPQFVDVAKADFHTKNAAAATFGLYAP